MHKMTESVHALLCSMALTFGAIAGYSQPLATEVFEIERPTVPYRVWQSQPPEDCPFQKSEKVAGVAFTGRHAEYTAADTWYPSWGADDRMYSTYTDGSVNGLFSASIDNYQNNLQAASTGSAVIVGDDPTNLEVVEERIFRSRATPNRLFPPDKIAKGRYPSASLMHKGVWYIGTYCLDDTLGPLGYNWGIMGAFVGFRWSMDKGVSWTDTDLSPEKPLFPQETYGNVRLGALHVVDFGKDLEHSPDGKIYLVGHGSLLSDEKPRDANTSWISGDQTYLTRVLPGPENINDASKYEFFSGHDSSGQPVWSPRYADLKPLIDWNNHCGCVTITHDSFRNLYLMCVTDGWPTSNAPFSSYILESDLITGPWKQVAYLKEFGEQAYFLNFPSRFISPVHDTLWLCYSANFSPTRKDGRKLWSNPRGSRYAMCLQEMKLLKPGDVVSDHPVLDMKENLAPLATLTSSSVYQPGYSLEGLVDGIVDASEDGFQRHEWASMGESVGAYVHLAWANPVRVGRIILYDRPNPMDQATSMQIFLSDGSRIDAPALPDDAKKGIDLRFASREVNWISIHITGVKPGSPNIGLAEVAVLEK